MQTLRIASAMALVLALLPGAALAQNVAPASGQSRVTGVVQTQGGGTATYTPLAGVTVQLLQSPDTATTDDDGHFSLGGVTAGQYTLEARRIGFLPVKQTIQVPPNRTVSLTVRMVAQRPDTLTRTPVELQAITITAAAPEAHDNPASTITIPPLVITQTAATNTYDLLRQAAGVEVHLQGQGPGFASDASIRGFSSDHSTDMALWVDGVPINESVNGHAEGYNDWFLVFPQAIEAVDVIKGPTSPVYGNFAMSGVVNMRTLEHMHDLEMWVSGGAFSRAEGALLGGWESQNSHGVIGIRGETQDGWRPNSDYQVGQFHGRWVQNLSPSASLDAGLELYGTKWHSPGFLTEDQFEARDYNEVANPTDGGFKRRAQERLSLKVVGGPSLLWRTTLYSTQGLWQLFLTTPPEGGLAEGTGSQTEEDDLRHGFGGTSAVTFQSSREELTIGAEGRYDQSNYQNWFVTDRTRDSSQILADAHQNYGGIFIATTTDITNRLRLDIGGRLDARNTTTAPPDSTPISAGASIVSPKLGILYHLPIGGHIYANVSRGFRQTDGVITDPTLPFITAWAYETGFRLESAHLTGSIALFRMDVSNEQTFDPVTLTTTSGGASRRQGVEIEARARPNQDVEFDADWTFNDAKYQNLVTSDGDTLSGVRVFNTSRFVGSLALEVAPPSSIWQVRLSSNIQGPYSPFDEPGVELPTYALLHVTGGVRIGGGLFQFGVRNLLNEAYRELRAGGSVSPGQPRTIYGQMQYHFK